MKTPFKILAVIDAPDTGVEQVLIAATDAHADDSHAASVDAHAEEATTAHTTEPASHGADEGSEGIGALGLDPIAIGAQALTFLVLFWVIKVKVMDGLVSNLDKRHKDIDRGLHLSAEMDKQKEELDARIEKALKVARKDADAVIADANAESGKIVQAAEEAANRKAEEIMRAAEGKIEREIADARKGLKAEMAGLITDATEAILNDKLDSGSDRKLVEKYLQEAMK